MENKMMVMRRALRDVSRVAEEMTRGTMTGESVDRKTVDAWAMRLCEIISRDLAIPLRNCDRFGGDPKMLHTAWWDWTGSPSGKDENGVARMTFDQWLLAPIEEGGAE